MEGLWQICLGTYYFQGLDVKVKILHVNYYDKWTGSGIAVNRLHTALRRSGIDSHMLVMRKDSDDPTIHEASRFPDYTTAFLTQRIAAQILKLQHSVNPAPHSLNIFSNPVIQMIKRINPDIVHLHWIGGEMLSIQQLPQIPYPLVWTLHDSWAFCGTEHYPDVREHTPRFVEGYTRENCSLPQKGLDIARFVWECKRKYWTGLNVAFTAPSRWLSGSLSRSKLFFGRECVTIPNCIDLDVFSPVSSSEARKKWGIPVNVRVILFGAQSTDNPLKGVLFLRDALVKLQERNQGEKYILLIFGKNSDDSLFQSCGFPCIQTGTIQNVKDMVSVYQASDVFVCPSLIDNLPNTVMEATACGIPTVAFHVGGLLDLIHHRSHGYLALPYDVQDLADGIEWCLNAPAKIRRNAREYALQNFSEEIVARLFTKLYEKIWRKE